MHAELHCSADKAHSHPAIARYWCAQFCEHTVAESPPHNLTLLAALQVAQQDAERARFTVTRAEQEKKSTIVRAKGEAESAKLIGQAVKENPAFLALRKIEAAREIADTVATAPNRLYLNSDSLLLDLTPKGQERS